MLLVTRTERERVDLATLALTRGEATDLIEKLRYLLEHPDYHHDHLEDYANRTVLDVLIITPSQLHTYDKEIRDQLKKIGYDQ